METRVREGRTALAVTVLLVATLTVPAILFGEGGFGLAQAQQSASPTPTGTAPTIQLLNPSDYEGVPVISDKDNNAGNNQSGNSPEDLKYHFNAWTRNAPNNATTEFFIVQGSNQISLGPGINRGNGVYDVYSAIPDSLNDTDATVRVVLFSAGEIARDEQAVVINQKTDPPPDPDVLNQGEYRATNAAETVEITYPPNAGAVGFFGRPGQPKSAQIEVTHSSTGSTAAGPENIRVFYTKSFRGTDPEWVACGTETQSNSADGVQCQLASGDTPDQVTGIAAVARDAEVEAVAPGNAQLAMDETNSGDAHMATGYNQVPASVSVSSPNSTVPGCSPLIIVEVKDHSARKIVGAPVDVHATGPTDSLAFDTEDDETGASGQPHDNDQPENHSTEPGRRCDGTLSEENQGEHEEAGSLPDRKHIESTNGTDSAGQFTFKLWNNTAGGTTTTAFVDMDDNDLFCATEASGNGVVNWGSGGPNPPLPSGPEQQSCPTQSSPSGSASGSTSPTATTSTSPSATASRSTSPSGSASTSASPSVSSSGSTSPSSASPSGSASTSTGSPQTGGTTAATTTTPAQAAVEISLEASQPRKTFGKSFTLSGAVTSSNAGCTDFVTVEILRDVVGGADEFAPFATTETDGNGAFTVTEKADRSANYVAQVAETALCDDASSSPQPVLVRVKVSLTLSEDRVPEGGRVRFRIETAPCPATARDKVLLFRAIQGEFGKSGRAKTNERCSATIVRRVGRDSVFQGRWPKQSAQFLAGKSRSKAVRVDG